jgi:hypothetical protein
MYRPTKRIRGFAVHRTTQIHEGSMRVNGASPQLDPRRQEILARRTVQTS